MTYLAELDAALAGPRRAKRDLLQEAADHLEDATEALVAEGWPAGEARARAEADFGPVDEIADAYQTTLAVASSRRTAGILVLALMFQPFLWDNGLRLADLAAPAQTPDTWWFAFLDELMEFGGAAMIAGAFLGLLATGVGNRRHHAGRALARATAIFTLVSSVVLPMLAAGMIVGGGLGARIWVLLAFLLLLPLAVASASAWRTLGATAQRAGGGLRREAQEAQHAGVLS
ncbi:MAG: permease prefix domain 1-containing protein [Actinomycetota bacterium]|nr:permease prefix domain 1-containing protein [Actinomycetota bacterium]